MKNLFVCGKLKEQFTQVFSNINTKQIAEQKLFHLKQTKLVTAYTLKFEQIAAKTK